MKKKIIVGILVIIAIAILDSKPWRNDEVTSDNISGYTLPVYNDYNYNYSDWDYDNSYDDWGDDDSYSDWEDDSFTMECNRCNGSGICEDCGGTGRSKYDGVLAASGCALCDATGDCYKCNGKGYTVHY